MGICRAALGLWGQEGLGTWAQWEGLQGQEPQGARGAFLGCFSICRDDPRPLCCEALHWLVQPGVLSLVGGVSPGVLFVHGQFCLGKMLMTMIDLRVSTLGHSCVQWCSARPYFPQPRFSPSNTNPSSHRCPLSLASPPKPTMTFPPPLHSQRRMCCWWRCAAAQQKRQTLQFLLKRWILQNYGVPAELASLLAQPARVREVPELLPSLPVLRCPLLPSLSTGNLKPKASNWELTILSEKPWFVAQAKLRYFLDSSI